MREIDKSRPLGFTQKMYNIFSIKRPIYKTWWLFPLVMLVFIFLVIIVPIIINEVYKVNDGYITLWGAPEVLSFYAVILSGIITISALIVTIYFSKRDTEKQIKFYMSQTKAPFFVIEGVNQLKSSLEFTFNDNHTWVKAYKVSKDGKLGEREHGKIEIVVNNIGDGMALMPSYQIDMFASTVVPKYIINKDTKITMTYDLQKNLDDKWVNYFFDGGKRNGSVEFYTYLKLMYQNVLGVELQQELKISVNLNLERYLITLTLYEMSPQQVFAEQ